MRTAITLTAILSILLVSCEKEIDVKLPAHEPGLVIYSQSEIDEPIALFIGKSVGILQYRPGKDYSMPEAVAILYENGQLADTLQYSTGTGLYESDVVATAGRNYEIKVSAPGFKTAEATMQVPQAVPIESIQQIRKVRSNQDGMAQDELRVRFTDLPGQADYYIMKINAVHSDSFTYYIGCVNSADPSVESIYNEAIDQYSCISAEGIFMKDQLFNGTTKELRLFANSQALEPATDQDNNTVYPFIELYHVSEDYFRFLKSYQFAAANQGNPFAEPTNVYSNVKNGYGIFSIPARHSREIK